MNTNQQLQSIDIFLKEHKTGDIVDKWCHSLFLQLLEGAEEPNWTLYPMGASYYKCREIYENKALTRKMKVWYHVKKTTCRPFFETVWRYYLKLEKEYRTFTNEEMYAIIDSQISQRVNNPKSKFYIYE